MSHITISCKECGAPLDIPPKAAQVNCGHCGAGHSIDQVAKRLEYIEEITRAWEEERKTYFCKDKNGEYTISRHGRFTMLGGILAVTGFALLCTAGLTHWLLGGNSTIYVCVLGGVSAMMGLILARAAFETWQKYLEAEGRYQEKRRIASIGMED